MFDTLRKRLYFSKLKLLFEKGIEDGSIVPFDEEFYQKMSDTYISGIPVSMHIKYLRPTVPPGKCYDRSLYMFLCFDDALLVRGNQKPLELKYGKECAGHRWIEIGDYVYDPTLLLRFKREVYYNMYYPSNVCKCTKEEYIEHNKEFYEDIKNTTLQDYQIGGRKRTDLCVTIPLLETIANSSNDEEFKRDVVYYLAAIQYDETQVYEEMNYAINSIFK